MLTSTALSEPVLRAVRLHYVSEPVLRAVSLYCVSEPALLSTRIPEWSLSSVEG